MGTYQDLKVYQKTKEFIVLLYKFTEALPDEEKFGLVAQLRRASISILLNLSEGSSVTNSKVEFHRFLNISLRSVNEVKAGLEICHALRFCTKKELDDLWVKLDEIGAMLTGLSRSLFK